ncbi:MAG: pyridoxal phosphate-dependent aminotransferase family protein [Comamonadaceae bacterium]|jgi:glycine C-acetyltransferase|uniref:aminotransferase class I/II-fold pyridoxal phosphate-dependent enzyme n=1 Tax=Candidatus Skiveiella danica TaxID=3386177 RepID=UPI0009D380C3|nr:pyridoxal phosphate-dependent aminotransferase family protein [Comamonadaceae bacterium]MBK9198248.1 pyridoxal phosphate-dependent aminotransferase family protein [Betaproteobacteria bacterium]MBP6505138.1 pyridoxal phosphate-dependent aminotransferase family protein [Rhodoferax sp.]OQC17956.1 MAG: 2-amino-3-ketobutyrate coenzyme A ligase [Alphaproteobacteria bacterium ADurb.Bin100]MBK6928635.1 pyridoxal phosphate-dependent aminotransferase family protein [Comamonadaceae bacterium]
MHEISFQAVNDRPTPYPPVAALGKSVAHFARPSGPNLLRRTDRLFQWVESRRQANVWPYVRSLDSAPAATAAIRYEAGDPGGGINLASQDYLGLSSHPQVHAAAIESVARFGVHSAGSGVLLGNTSISLELERSIAETLHVPHALLFPTGWAAGYGAVVALVRPDDHIVMDELAHACLQSGAQASTRNVVRVRHLDTEAFRAAIQRIRAADARNGILVITEGVFSMDADSPDIRSLQAICREYDATLLVDIAHDFGALGPGGTGQIGIQGMLGEVDLVMGSFSKTFASNGGFVAVRTPEVKQFMQIYAGSWMFSNALSPVQAATVLEALRIVRSPEGGILRHQLQAASLAIRDEFGRGGIHCLGEPTAIVPTPVGAEAIGRIASWLVFRKGALVNLAEFPVVPVGASRFRIQMMAAHTEAQARTGARLVMEALAEAREMAERHRSHVNLARGSESVADTPA